MSLAGERRVLAFLAGFGSIFDLSGEISYTTLRRLSPETDTSRSVWTSVGRDLQTALSRAPRELEQLAGR